MPVTQPFGFISLITALGIVLRNISTIRCNGVRKCLPVVPCLPMLRANGYSLPRIPCRAHQAVNELIGGCLPGFLPCSTKYA